MIERGAPVSEHAQESNNSELLDRQTWSNRLRLSSRFAGFLWHRFVENDCLRLAASLSFTSLLAIVPLTAIAFSMLAAFPVFGGVREKFQKVVFENFMPTSAEAMGVYFDQFV
ncbi:MAG: YhjD/YihY/BrkB family envelope integrity protein, partial [Rhodospirillales bacterium]